MATNEILKKLRTTRGLIQSEIAEKLGVSLSSYQKYEREKGSITPSLDVLVRIADFYGVSVDYLLGRDAEEPAPLEALSNQFNMSALEKEIVKGYLELPDDMRDDLMDFLERAVRKVAAESPVRWKAASSSDDSEPEITVLTEEERRRIEESDDETK